MTLVKDKKKIKGLKMNKETFLTEHFRKHDTIEVQCLYLQNQFKEALKAQRELKGYKDKVNTLLGKIDALELKIELLQTYPNFKLDEMA